MRRLSELQHVTPAEFVGHKVIVRAAKLYGDDKVGYTDSHPVVINAKAACRIAASVQALAGALAQALREEGIDYD